MAFKWSKDDISLHIDPDGEEAWVLVQPGASKKHMRRATELIKEHGYEIMPHWECPPTREAGGAERYWLAEKEEHGSID